MSKPEEPAVAPVAKPEPRRRIAGEPAAIFQGILSPSDQKRRAAFRQLGFDPDTLRSRTAQVDEAHLYMVNLDADEDLEAILIYIMDVDTVALVLDKDGKGWRRVGAFSCAELRRVVVRTPRRTLGTRGIRAQGHPGSDSGQWHRIHAD